jgi:DHA1 family multidrug resistance protein-like MFS transporter
MFIANVDFSLPEGYEYRMESVIMNSESEGISDEQRRKNLWVLAASSFLRGAHTTIYNVIWQPFALFLGASMPTVGLLNSLGGMNGLFTTVAQSLGGWLADRVGCKLFMIAASFVMITAYGLFILADLSRSGFWLLLGILFFGFSALSRPAISSMTAESAKTDQQGRMFSLMMFAWIVPGIIAPSAGGWLAERWGYPVVFFLMIGLEFLALVLIWRYLHERRHSWDEVNLAGIGRAFLRSFVPPKGLEWFFIANATDAFFWGMGWGLITGLLKDAQHFTVAQLGIMASVMSFTWALVQLPIGRYLDRYSTKKLLVISEALGAPIMLITMLHPTFPVMLALQVPMAILAAIWVPGVNIYLARAVKASERTESFGRLNMFRGIIAFPASWIGGLIYARWGFRAPLGATLIGVFVVLAMLIFCVHEPAGETEPNALIE